jgi:hypothetical protein
MVSFSTDRLHGLILSVGLIERWRKAFHKRTNLGERRSGSGRSGSSPPLFNFQESEQDEKLCSRDVQGTVVGSLHPRTLRQRVNGLTGQSQGTIHSLFHSIIELRDKEGHEDMSQDLPPLKTYQFFSSCRLILGMSYLQKVFKRAQAEIYRWGANPDTNADTARNPLDRYEHLLGKLMELGHEDTARAAVSRQAQVVGCELSCLDTIIADAPSVEAECLDDYPALTVFHTAIRNGDSPEVVRHLWQQAKRELDETYQAFVCRGEIG